VRACSGLVALATAIAPVHASAAASIRTVGEAQPAEGAAERAPATIGGSVALLRFTGDPAGNELRSTTQVELEQAGFTVKSVALDLPAAAKKLKCRGEPSSDACLDAIGTWLAKSPKTAADFLVFGDAQPVASGVRVTLTTYDFTKKQIVAALTVDVREGDLIVPIIAPRQVATGLQQHLSPPGPATAEEQALLAELDEPAKTPEELAAEQKALADAEAAAAERAATAEVDVAGVEVDLKADFKELCREGARRPRESKDDPKDLRPKCSMGPFWGYWQERAWVALGLTSAAAIGTIVSYGLAAGARGPYTDAVSALDAFNASVGDDPRLVPTSETDANGNTYTDLASEVSRTGRQVRNYALTGDILLGATVVLGGVLGIIIWQDRSAAREFLKAEKQLKLMSDRRLRVTPLAGIDGSYGAGVRLSF
jgi:hypothetical protein